MNFLFQILKWPFNKFSQLSKKGKITTLVIISLLVIYNVISYRNSGLEVQLTEPKRQNLVEVVSAPGEIAATQSANLAFQTAGEVKELNFNFGDKVKKGDTIAKLDTTLLYANYQQSEANFRAANAALLYTYDTLQGKEKTESFSEISTRTNAETNKDKAYWAYASASKSLTGAYIVAPFDGILTQVPENLVTGSLVSLPTTSVFQVVNPETTFFEAEINENDVQKIKEGSQVNIEIDAYPNEVFEGRLQAVNFKSKVTSTGGTAYSIRITLPNNNGLKFRLGMNGDADIILDKKEDVLTVPVTSIVESDDSTYVWVNNNGKAKKVIVETGISSFNDIEIISGVDENDKILTRPPSDIEEGARLKSKNN